MTAPRWLRSRVVVVNQGAVNRESGALAHRIFDKLPPDQQWLLDIIAEQVLSSGRWPVYDYIDRTFRDERVGDTLATMQALPIVAHPPTPGGYKMLFSEDGQSWGNPDRRMGLTVAGMWHVTGLRPHAEAIVRAVGAIAGRDTKLAPDPDQAVHLVMTVDELLTAMGPSPGTGRPACLLYRSSKSRRCGVRSSPIWSSGSATAGDCRCFWE